MFHVVGHKKPDTDSVCSAIAYAYYLNQKGQQGIACRNGEINPETKFVLERFGAEEPEPLGEAKRKNVILVDHNEKAQSPDDIDEAGIAAVIDHHKISFDYPRPIVFHTEPIGSTATIIAKRLLTDPEVELTPQIAGLLLSAILSDTVVFRSPTTTEEDRHVAHHLAEIAEIEDIEEFGIEIKKAKANLEGMSAEDILFGDFKEYEFGEKKIGVGQVEITGMDQIENRKQELLETIKNKAQERNYELFVFMATDIIEQGTLLLFWEKENYIQKTFGKEPENNSVYLEGVMSRKKQVVPPLTNTLSGE
ncbi:MAG: manganese-dependent inorganic pyrophosphatase [Candidatus Nealsonbacteria bacterium]|nr:manganese-dependent inorganic pyrophosphatase [Candidatus Nealsonbacteria bacterium]